MPKDRKGRSASLPSYAPLDPAGALPPGVSADIVARTFKHARKDWTPKRVLATLNIEAELAGVRDQLRVAMDRPIAREAAFNARGQLLRPAFHDALYHLLRGTEQGKQVHDLVLEPSTITKENKLFLDPDALAVAISQHRETFSCPGEFFAPDTPGETLALFCLAFGLLQPKDAAAIVRAACGLGAAFKIFFGLSIASAPASPPVDDPPNEGTSHHRAQSAPLGEDEVGSWAKDALHRITELRRGAANLATLMASAADGLEADARLPPAGIAEAIAHLQAETGRLATELRARDTNPAASRAEAPSLVDLEARIRALAERQGHRLRALAVVNRAGGFRLKDGGELPGHERLEAVTRELRETLAEESDQANMLASELIEDRHPLAQLLRFADAAARPGVEETETFFEAIDLTFGRSLALAAAQGRLTIEPSVAASPPKRAHSPSPPSPPRSPVQRVTPPILPSSVPGGTEEHPIERTEDRQAARGVNANEERHRETLQARASTTLANSQAAESPPGRSEAPPFEREGLLSWQALADGRTDLSLQIARCMEQLTPVHQPLWMLPSLPLLCLFAPRARSGAIGGSAKALHRAVQHVWEDLCVGLPRLTPSVLEATTLLALVACLRPALLSPETDARALLRETLSLPDGLEAVHTLRIEVLGFAKLGFNLTEPLLSGVQRHAAWEQLLANKRQDCRDWLERNRQASMIYFATTSVWRYWLGPDGPLGELFAIPLQQAMDRVEELRRELAPWQDDLFVRAQAEKADRALRGPKADRNPIEARAVTSLEKHAREAVKTLRAWLDGVDSQPGDRADYQFQQIEGLRTTILATVAEARAQVAVVARNDDVGNPLGCAARAAENLLAELEVLFTGDRGETPADTDASLLANGVLLRVPGLSLDGEWSPEAYSPADLLTRLAKLPADCTEAWEEAFEAHCVREDHRATERILDLIDARPEMIDIATDLRDRRKHSLEEAQRRLAAEVEEARSKLARAAVNDVLPPAEQLALSGRLDTLQADTTLLFPAARDVLRDVTAEIERFSSARAQSVERRLRDEIPDASPELQSGLERLLAAGDFVTANEYIDLARDGKRLERPIEEDLLASFFPGFVKTVADYLRPNPNPSLILDKIRDRRSFGPINLDRVSPEQAASAHEMLEAWYSARRRGREKPGLAPSLQRVFQGIGLSDCHVEGSRPESANKVWWGSLRTAPLADRSICALPDFGSMAKGNYALLCVWGHLPEQELLRIAEARAVGQTVLAVVFSAIPEERRRDLADLCRDRRKRLLVLDEALVYFLCTTTGSRLQAFFRCALPFTVNDPYTTTASFLPPEMFYGRAAERDAVVSRTGTNLVFGGRQIGKTALLREVQRRYDRPEEGAIVRWIDLKNEGIGTFLPIDDLWKILAAELERAGVPRPTSTTWDGVSDRIREWLDQRPTSTILFLLDEADTFLASDAEHHFELLGRLKSLMEVTERRFKVVFAGLHNVQRASRDPNSPIGHLGEPICIGPLLGEREAREALELVTRPLLDLGYRFESDDLPLRVVAHCNYYPSLIQVYCKHLLAHLSDPKRLALDPRDGPPYLISARDLDKVQNLELREKIRGKFRLTLDLDPRYRLIALCLAHAVFEQDSTGSIQKAVDPEWTLRQALYWWPDGFAGVATRESLAVLLDEMVGLGVLRHLGPQSYALRTPNLAVLLGTPAEIENQLLDASAQERPVPYEAASFRRAGPSAPWQRSPITAEQESEIFVPRSGVALIFGGSIAGAEHLEHFLRLAHGEGGLRVMSDIRSARDLRERLSPATLPDSPSNSVFLVPFTSAWNAEWVAAACEATRAAGSGHIRVAFLGRPRHAWAWAAAPLEQRDGLRQHGVRELTLRPWADSTLRRWLQETTIASGTDAEAAEIRRVTGNWDAPLLAFGESCNQGVEPWEVDLRTIETKLTDGASWLDRFEVVPEAHAILRRWAEYGDVTESDLRELAPEGDLEPGLCGRVIEWADLLAYTLRGLGESWRLDPVLERLLLAVH